MTREAAGWNSSGRLRSGFGMPGAKSMLGAYLRDESGQAMTEYVLIIALVALPIWALFRIAIVAFLNVFISNMLSSFTRG